MSASTLLPWIDEARLDWTGLSSNPSPGASAMLATRPDKIHYYFLSRNHYPAPTALLLSFPGDKQCKSGMAGNSDPAAVDAVLAMPDTGDMCVTMYLSGNENARMLEFLTPTIVRCKNPCYTDISEQYMSANRAPEAMALLAKYKWLVDTVQLSKNPTDAAMALLTSRTYKINWKSLSANPHPTAVGLMKANPDRVVWKEACKNPNPDAIALLAANTDVIDWTELSANPGNAAVALLVANHERADCLGLAKNTNPDALAILEARMSKLDPLGPTPDWAAELSRNPSRAAVALLETRPRWIVWGWLSANPRIFAGAAGEVEIDTYLRDLHERESSRESERWKRIRDVLDAGGSLCEVDVLGVHKESDEDDEEINSIDNDSDDDWDTADEDNEDDADDEDDDEYEKE